MITRTTTVTMKTISLLMTIALIINENKDDNGGNNRDNEDGNDDCNDENISPKTYNDNREVKIGYDYRYQYPK